MTHLEHSEQELPASPGRIALFAVVALSLGIGLAYVLWQPSGPRCVGVVGVRCMVVTAPCDGAVAEYLVKEGQQVEIGTHLVKLSDSGLLGEIASAEQQIVTLTQELKQAQATAQLELEWRLHTLASEIAEIQLRSAGFLREQYDFELQRNMLSDLLNGDAVALVGTAPLEALGGNGEFSRTDRLTSVMRLEAAQNAAEVAAAQVEICEAQVQRLEKLKVQLPEQIRQSNAIEVAEARLQEADARLKQLRNREQELVVSSPAIGRVGVLKSPVGDVLKKGDKMLELLDSAQRFLMVHVPSRHITHYGEGTEVKLTFPGNERRTGKVSRVSPQTASTDTSPALDSDAAVVVFVEQTGAFWPEVPVGARVSVVR